jgi:hypothetical protein
MTAEGKTPKNLVEEMVPLLDSREIMLVTQNSNNADIHFIVLQKCK